MRLFCTGAKPGNDEMMKLDRMFNRLLFSATLQSKLLQDGLSLREAAKESGVSASTLSRIINGDALDIDSFAALVCWMESDTNQFFEQSSQDRTIDKSWADLYLSLQQLGAPVELIEAI